MRKYKQVKEKQVTFDMREWAEVERRAAAAGSRSVWVSDKILLTLNRKSAIMMVIYSLSETEVL